MNVPYSRLLIALFWVCLSIHAEAACNDSSALRAAVASGYVPDSQALVSCKAMLTNPKQTIVAFVRALGNHTYSMTVLVAIKDDGTILHSFVDEDPFFGPNGDPTSIEVDTARYFLAPNKQAFGVRVTHSLNPWDSTVDLNLFLSEGKLLRRILKNLRIASASMRGCPLGAHQTSRTISVAKTRSEGFNDLIVRSNDIQYEPRELNSNECSYRELARSSKDRLQFIGGSYAYPPGFY